MALDWANVVGTATLEDGGKAGDLLKLTLAHLDDAKLSTNLTQEEVGAVYAGAIQGAISGAINFEVQAEQIRLSKVTSTLRS